MNDGIVMPRSKSKMDVESSSEMFFDNQKVGSEWLSTEAAASFLSISTNALRIMFYRGQIQAYKFGRRLRFKLRDCEALIVKKGA